MNDEQPTKRDLLHAIVYAVGLACVFVSFLVLLAAYLAGILFAIAAGHHLLACALIGVGLVTSFLFRNKL